MAMFTCTYLWWFVIQFLWAFHALTTWCDGRRQITPMWSHFSFFWFRGLEVSWDLLRHFPHFLPGFYGASLWFNGKGDSFHTALIWNNLEPHDSWHLKNRSWKMCFLLGWYRQTHHSFEFPQLSSGDELQDLCVHIFNHCWCLKFFIK